MYYAPLKKIFKTGFVLGDKFGSVGRANDIVVPRLSSDCTQISPPWALMMLFAMKGRGRILRFGLRGIIRPIKLGEQLLGAFGRDADAGIFDAHHEETASWAASTLTITSPFSTLYRMAFSRRLTSASERRFTSIMTCGSGNRGRSKYNFTPVFFAAGRHRQNARHKIRYIGVLKFIPKLAVLHLCDVQKVFDAAQEIL